MLPSDVAPRPIWSVRKCNSTGAACPPAARVPGSGFFWAKVSPLLSVRKTVPSVSRRKPVWRLTNQPATSCSLQLDSTGVNATRVNVAPPSSERRATQPPPANSALPSIAWTSVRFVNVPLSRPVQVAPPSLVRSNVPKSPAAYPVAPANDIARSVLPCGSGLPHCHPDDPTCTLAGASAGKTPRTPTTHASAPANPTRLIGPLLAATPIIRAKESGSRDATPTSSVLRPTLSQQLPALGAGACRPASGRSRRPCGGRR